MACTTMVMVPAAGSAALDGERNALALLVQAQNDELPRPLLARDARRLNRQTA